MKERYRAWASLTATPQKRPAGVRLIDLPGVRDLETLEVLNSIARTKDDDRLAARINDVSRKHFGITEADTIFITEEALDQIKRRDPDKAYELENDFRKYERQFFCKPSLTV